MEGAAFSRMLRCRRAKNARRPVGRLRFFALRRLACGTKAAPSCSSSSEVRIKGNLFLDPAGPRKNCSSHFEASPYVMRRRRGSATYLEKAPSTNGSIVIRDNEQVVRKFRWDH